VRIFISSIIGGYEAYRAAAAEAAETLGHQVVRAEDFPASSATPQQACLAAVRKSDLVVLLIGGRYGAPQPSGLSATHEEYREAKERKPVLVFVESGVERDPEQQDFLDEVEAWATGHYRRSYSTPDELKRELLRALHDHELATAVGPVDEAEMVERAKALLPRRDGGWGGDRLGVAVAAGPHQQVVRPAQLDDAALMQAVHREATFGDHPVLDPATSTNREVRGSSLLLGQSSATVRLDEDGSIYVAQPARRTSAASATQLPALIEEDLALAIGRAIRFSGWLLDHIDPVRRLTDVVVIAHTVGAGYMPWRTREEHAASPDSAAMSGGNDAVAVLTPARRPRQALTLDADRLTQDLVAVLRRGHRS
jgi:hypothetical protein